MWKDWRGRDDRAHSRGVKLLAAAGREGSEKTGALHLASSPSPEIYPSLCLPCLPFLCKISTWKSKPLQVCDRNANLTIWVITRLNVLAKIHQHLFQHLPNIFIFQLNLNNLGFLQPHSFFFWRHYILYLFGGRWSRLQIQVTLEDWISLVVQVCISHNPCTMTLVYDNVVIRHFKLF